MWLETVLVNGMRVLAPVEKDKPKAGHFSINGKSGSYIVHLGRQRYACERQNGDVVLRIKGDNLAASFRGDEYCVPEIGHEQEEKEEDYVDISPGLGSVGF